MGDEFLSKTDASTGVSRKDRFGEFLTFERVLSICGRKHLPEAPNEPDFERDIVRNDDETGVHEDTQESWPSRSTPPYQCCCFQVRD